MSEPIDPRVALEIFRLKARASIVEGLVLRLHLLMPILSAPDDPYALRSSLAATRQMLEVTATTAESAYLGDTEIVAHDAERAQYAEEFREIVERLKSLADRIAENIAKR